MSPEEKQQRRERFRQRMERLSPEEKRAMREKFRERKQSEAEERGTLRDNLKDGFQERREKD
jgi:hypothetical protein